MGSMRDDRGVLFYACRRARRQTACGGMSITGQPLGDYIRDLVCTMLADPTTRSMLLKLTDLVHNINKVTDIATVLNEIRQRRARVLDLYADGDLSRSEKTARLAALDTERQDAELALSGRGAHNVLAGLPDSYDALRTIWDARGAEWQRSVITATLEPITVNSGTGGRRPKGQPRLDTSRLVVTAKA